jgi:AcrR family transcriptional regulator
VEARRRPATAQRRDDILAAALKVSVYSGESGTFIQEVCAKAGVSVGTLYHHFGSKDELIATLHFTLLNRYQAGAGEILDHDSGAEQGIRDTVGYHARWLMAHPLEATFLLQQPFAGYRSDNVPGELKAENEAFLATVRAWLDRQMEAGRIKRLPFDMVVALLIGPVHHWVRAQLWVTSKTQQRPAPKRTSGRGDEVIDVAVDQLAGGIWHSLRPEDPPAVRPSGTRRSR